MSRYVNTIRTENALRVNDNLTNKFYHLFFKISLIFTTRLLQLLTSLLVSRHIRLVFELFLATATLEHRCLSVLRCTVSIKVRFIVCFVAAFAARVQIVLALMVAQSHGGAVFPATECTLQQSLVVVGCEVLVKTAL